MEAFVPGLGRACGYWAARCLERRPSDGRRHSCPPLASSCSESGERETEIASLQTILDVCVREKRHQNQDNRTNVRL